MTGAAPVVVVGGGLAGLALAFRAAGRGGDVVLVEREARLGGQIHTREDAGVFVELGAEGFVARSEVVPRLCADVGIDADLIDQSTTTTYALTRGSLVELAPGEAATILGFQVPKEELGRGIRSLARGMGQLVGALEQALGDRVSVLRGARVTAIEGAPAGPRVHLADGRTIAARALVITAPARVAATLLGGFGERVRALSSGRVLSNASATLLYDESQLSRPLAGSGFIVPQGEQRDGFRACSFVSTKLPRPAPPGTALVRAFFRPSDERAAAASESDWISLASTLVGEAMGIRGAPLRGWASAWPRALPVYDDGYRRVVAEAEAELVPFGIHLAGSHFHGAGIDAAVRSAEGVAALVSGA